VTGRTVDVDLQTKAYFEIADDASLSYDDKVDRYLALADEHFETERYHDWCATHLPHLDEQVYDWVVSEDFERILLETVRATYPPHEHDQFMAHFTGLLDLWERDNAARGQSVSRAAPSSFASSPLST